MRKLRLIISFNFWMSFSNEIKTLEISARFEKLESRIQDLTPPAGAEKITHKRNNKGQFEKVN